MAHTINGLVNLIVNVSMCAALRNVTDARAEAHKAIDYPTELQIIGKVDDEDFKIIHAQLTSYSSNT